MVVVIDRDSKVLARKTFLIRDSGLTAQLYRTADERTSDNMPPAMTNRTIPFTP